MPRNLSIALRIAQPIFHGDEQSDEDMRNRSAENIPTMQMQRILYIRANIDYVRRRFAFTGMKRRRFIEMRFFSSSFSPELRSSVFCHANLNCLLLTFRCFISSLACNHQSIRSCNKESRHAATRYADTGLKRHVKIISLHFITFIIVQPKEIIS